jgi:hypothetical protein
VTVRARVNVFVDTGAGWVTGAATVPQEGS